MKFEVPQHTEALFKRSEELKFVYENVLKVVMDYNKILTSLSSEERLLFKQLLLVVEKKISPGLSQLTWSMDVGEEYIAECSHCTADLQEFVDEYKTCNLKIVSICEKICDTPFINLQPSNAMDLTELTEEMHTYRSNVVVTLVSYYQDIVRYLIVVYEGFESNISNVSFNWVMVEDV